VRHSHAFLARLHNVLRDRAPDVLDALLAAGATEMPFTENLPETLTDRSPRPGDEDLVALACRRTTFEWVLRRCVLGERGVEFRHGVAATALRSVRDDGVPRVTGVDDLDADVVIDARGPRSSSDDWLAAIGAAPVPEQLHESGIVYFSRFYRLHGAAPPANVGPVAADIGYLKFAIFVGDNDTFSITYAIEHDDEELRRKLLDPEPFERVATSLTVVAPWRAPGVAEPITDVHVMAGLRNRYRPFVDEAGEPLVRGFVPVGDAAVCTNPLYGRGCSLALVHAYGLADTLREHGDGFEHPFADFTGAELVPWFRSAVFQDEQAHATGEPSDERAFMQSVMRDGLVPAMRTSPAVFRAFLRWFNLLATPDALVSDPEVVTDVLAAYQERDNHPEPEALGPDRPTLLGRL
jgi:2-polyprenyl-6-methoxyphenol hydroxylase-like FAD-dependent oxidoreductase